MHLLEETELQEGAVGVAVEVEEGEVEVGREEANPRTKWLS